MQTVKNPKPFLKWVGGKTQIIDAVLSKIPTDIHGSYHELFLGGGSVLFAVLCAIRAGNIRLSGSVFAYDANVPLIALYKNIQSAHHDVATAVTEIVAEFIACPVVGVVRHTTTTRDIALLNRENYYYWIRHLYNTMPEIERQSILGSARFLFLNKTCFRGLFRTGPNGFNVAYGHYKNPEVVDVSNLQEIHELIQGVEFRACDFSASTQHPGDFVYMDPPYAPENATSFTAYTREGFNTDQHIALFRHTHRLSDIGVQWTMSNADVALVRTNYTQEKYRIESIICRRAINSKRPDATAREVLITNWV